MTIIDSATLEVETALPVGGYPSGLTHVPEFRRLYVGNSLGSTMSVIDLDTLETVATVDAEPGAGAIGVDQTRRLVVCVNFVAASANFYDTDSFADVGRLELGIGTCAIGIVPERGEAFIVNSIAGTVSRVDLDRIEVIEEIRTGSAPVGLTMHPSHDRAYVTNRGAGSVSVRTRGKGDQGSQTLDAFLTHAMQLVSEHSMEL